MKRHNHYLMAAGASIMPEHALMKSLHFHDCLTRECDYLGIVDVRILRERSITNLIGYITVDTHTHIDRKQNTEDRPHLRRQNV